MILRAAVLVVAAEAENNPDEEEKKTYRRGIYGIDLYANPTVGRCIVMGESSEIF